MGSSGQSAEIRAGAVVAGGEGRRRGRGLGLGAWFAIGWMVFIIVIAVLAKTGILHVGRLRRVASASARAGARSPTRAARPASCSAATATAAT